MQIWKDDQLPPTTTVNNDASKTYVCTIWQFDCSKYNSNSKQIRARTQRRKLRIGCRAPWVPRSPQTGSSLRTNNNQTGRNRKKRMQLDREGGAGRGGAIYRRVWGGGKEGGRPRVTDSCCWKTAGRDKETKTEHEHEELRQQATQARRRQVPQTHTRARIREQVHCCQTSCIGRRRASNGANMALVLEDGWGVCLMGTTAVTTGTAVARCCCDC